MAHIQNPEFTYALGLEMCPSQAVMVLVEVHHLEAVELIRHGLDLLLLVLWNNFDAFRIPSDILSWGWLSLAICLDGAVGSFAGMDVVWNWARHVDFVSGLFRNCSAESIWYVPGGTL